jgi:hypothetical protein
MVDFQSMYKNKSFAAIMLVALMLSFVSCSSAEKTAGNKVDGMRNIASTSAAAMDLEDIDDDGLPASEVNSDVERVGGFIENRKTGDLLVLACAKADEKHQCTEFSFVVVSGSSNPKVKPVNTVVNKKPMTFNEVEGIADLVYVRAPVGYSGISYPRFFGWTIAFWDALWPDGAHVEDVLLTIAPAPPAAGVAFSVSSGSLAIAGIVAGAFVLLPALPTIGDIAKAPFMYGSIGVVDGICSAVAGTKDAIQKQKAKKDQKLFDKVLVDNVTAYRKVSNRRFERLIRAIEVASQ